MDSKAQAGLTVGLFLGVVAIIAVIVMIFGGFYSVPGGSVGVKFVKWGDAKGFRATELPQGFGLKIPMRDQVYSMPFRTQEIGFFETNGESIVPKDSNGINFRTDLVVRYRLDPTQAAEFCEQKGCTVAAMTGILRTAARADSTRGVLGQVPQEDVPKQRIELAVQIKDTLQKRIDQEASGRLKPGFIVIESVDLRNINFNERIEQRIVEKQVRLQEAQEMEYRLEIQEKEKDRKIIEAEGVKQSQILQAEGKAQAILLEATAKAEGIQKVNDAYQDMPAAFVSTKWAESIQTNDKIIFGLENMGGNLLPFLDVNEVAALKAKGTIG